MSPSRSALVLLAIASIAAGCVSPATDAAESIVAPAGGVADIVILEFEGEVATDGYSRAETVDLPDGVRRARIEYAYALGDWNPLTVANVRISIGSVTPERVFHLVFAGRGGSGGEWQTGQSERGGLCGDREDDDALLARQDAGTNSVDLRFEGNDGTGAVRVTALPDE